MDYIEEYKVHVEKNGVKGLLPQNLPNSILNRMLLEIKNYEENDSKIPDLLKMPIYCRHASTWPPIRINTWPVDC